jgi:serine/threonine protein kinase
LLVGSTFGDFTVLDFLGHGGHSEVYRVRDPGSGQVQALKLLPAREPGARQRLEREFAITKALDHPHIVAVYELGSVGDLLWMTMRYVDGFPASRLVPATRVVPDLPLVLTVLGQVAEALDYAHANAVLHGDVKPANMFVCAGEPPCALLGDFGIARYLDGSRALPRNGRMVGSLPYAAPEVLAGQQLHPSTDVYSLACALVELLTGRPPFPFSTRFAVTHAHISRPPPRISRGRDWIPTALDSVLAKAMAKDPTRRYCSATVFATLVAHALRGADLPVGEQ